MIIFISLQAYTFLCVHIPWPLLRLSIMEQSGQSGGVDQSLGSSPTSIDPSAAEDLKTDTSPSKTKFIVISLLCRVVGILLQSINVGYWLKRQEFNRHAHFIHWVIGNISLFLTLTWVQSDLTNDLVSFLMSAAVVFQIGVLSLITALTPFHGVLVTVVAAVVQIAALANTIDAEHSLDIYQGVMMFSSVLVPVLLALAAIFCDSGSKTKAKRGGKKYTEEEGEIS